MAWALPSLELDISLAITEIKETDGSCSGEEQISSLQTVETELTAWLSADKAAHPTGVGGGLL